MLDEDVHWFVRDQCLVLVPFVEGKFLLLVLQTLGTAVHVDSLVHRVGVETECKITFFTQDENGHRPVGVTLVRRCRLDVLADVLACLLLFRSGACPVPA